MTFQVYDYDRYCHDVLGLVVTAGTARCEKRFRSFDFLFRRAKSRPIHIQRGQRHRLLPPLYDVIMWQSGGNNSSIIIGSLYLDHIETETYEKSKDSGLPSHSDSSTSPLRGGVHSMSRSMSRILFINTCLRTWRGHVFPSPSPPRISTCHL